MPLNKHEEIRKFVRAKVGDPVVKLCDNEVAAIDEAVSSASFKYWTALPYTKVDTIKSSTSGGAVTITWDSVLDKFITDPSSREESYFIGVQRYDIQQPFGAVLPRRSFDLFLSGAQGVNVDNFGARSRGYRYNNISDELALINTQEDIVNGELDINYDYLNSTVEFTVPSHSGVKSGGFGNVAVWYGMGFTPSKTIDVVPMMYFATFQKMVAWEFMETIIQGRSAITLATADYQINLSALEKARDTLKEEIEEELASMARMPNVWG